MFSKAKRLAIVVAGIATVSGGGRYGAWRNRKRLRYRMNEAGRIRSGPTTAARYGLCRRRWIDGLPFPLLSCRLHETFTRGPSGIGLLLRCSQLIRRYQ